MSRRAFKGPIKTLKDFTTARQMTHVERPFGVGRRRRQEDVRVVEQDPREGQKSARGREGERGGNLTLIRGKVLSQQRGVFVFGRSECR